MENMQGTEATQKMPAYVGTKIVCAHPMTAFEFGAMTGRGHSDQVSDQEGFLVVYPDGYKSWSPKETFEAAYRLVSPAEARLI